MSTRIPLKSSYHSTDVRTCSFFLRGGCKYGNNCKFVHEPANVQTLNDAQTESSSVSAKNPQHVKTHQSPRPSPRPSSKSKSTQVQTRKQAYHAPTSPVNSGSTDQSQGKTTACRAWKDGACAYGDRCRFVHDPQVQEAELLRKAEMASRDEVEAQKGIQAANTARRARAKQHAEQVQRDADQQAELAQQETARKARQEAQRAEREAARQAKLAEQEAGRQAQQAQREARKAELAEKEAAMTVKHNVLGSIVTFGAGLTIQNTITGFESCHFRVKNLPADAKLHEVHDLFTQQGLEPVDFHVLGVRKTPDGRQEASVMSDAETGKMIVVGLDGIEFRQEKLLFKMTENGRAEGMGASAGRNSQVLTVSWHAPSISFVAEYPNISQAEDKVKQLDRNICAGRRVKVEMNRPPPGRVIIDFHPNSVKIIGLPLSVTETDIVAFSGSTVLKRLKPADYDVNQALQRLRQHIECYANGGLQTFETMSTDPIDGKIAIQAHFNSWEQAKKAYDSLVDQRFPYIANSTFFLRLPLPHHYTITIPAEQYKAQKRRWDGLTESTKGQSCNLRIHAQGKAYTIRVLGEDKKAVGSLKVRAESLAAGEKIESWHRSLAFGTGTQFLNSVLEATGAFIRHDWKVRALKVYGDPDAVQKARAMVESEVERLASLEWTVFLKRHSVRFFVRHGLSALKETLGEDNVTLDISSSPCKITIRGGEEARYVLERLIEDSLSDSSKDQSTGIESKCPICYDDVSAPVPLACGHIYCTACIRHFLATASDTKLLPLSCMGDEAKCRVPISIPTVQKFLQLQQFNRLLEVAFMSHVEQHPQDFKYCTTPDCRQIYRCSNSTEPLVLHCPACLSAVCSSCHEEAHEGLRCFDRKLAEREEHLNEEWAKQQGVKKCPSCKVWIEKIDGCNHMACKCGAHICWKCMGIFNQDEIYGHMTATHGGYDDGVDFVEPEEIRAQERLLLQAIRVRRDREEEEQLRMLREALRARRELEGEANQREANREGLRRDALRRQREADQEAQRQRQGGCLIM